MTQGTTFTQITSITLEMKLRTIHHTHFSTTFEYNNVIKFFCLPDSLDLDHCLLILFWLSTCE